MSDSARQAEAAALDAENLRLIADGRGDFEGLALRLFAHQFAHNRIYQSFCRRRGRTPDTVDRWTGIPAVPTSAFKHAEIATFPLARAVAEFHTSGTTGHVPGRHFFETTALYDAGMVRHFGAMMLPDLLPAGVRPHLLALTAAPREMPHSSLVHMIAGVMDAFDAAGRRRFFVRDGRLDAATFAEETRRCDGPVCVLSTAFALVHLLDAGTGPIPLPPGSRVMETGGFKGRSREVERGELYRRVAELFAVPEGRIVAEYGMTELSSQFYDASLVIGHPSLAAHPRVKVPPAWMRSVAVDPVSLEPLPPGETGLLRHVDLCNRGSVIAVQTEDLGRVVDADGGIELFGRAPEAEPRGCSRAVEDLLLGTAR